MTDPALRICEQVEFNFDHSSPVDGYSDWMTTRGESLKDIARQISLPLGHRVEIWLKGEVRLRGLLTLTDNLLFVEHSQIRHLSLKVDGVPFLYPDIESCVRLD